MYLYNKILIAILFCNCQRQHFLCNFCCNFLIIDSQSITLPYQIRVGHGVRGTVSQEIYAWLTLKNQVTVDGSGGR